MIASAQGRSGKTTIGIGLCAALRQRGLSVQPFKKGPDYIDASWLSAAAGRACRNLDIFMMREEVVRASFLQACRGVDFALIEGAMGLYDGVYSSGRGSSAHLARLIHVPVILIVNAARMTRSAAAMVIGYQHFEPETEIAGLILNSVSGKRHEH
jgi:cobyrinic acid a,c-diamide synthase